MTGRGRLIAFEGGEACGKSTQAALLAHRLGALLTMEPGGTELGRSIRALVLAPASEAIDPRAEALLMAADRAQHVVAVVRPALDDGRDVVTDRYVGSSLAYQGWGRGLAVDELRGLSRWATGGLEADVVVLLEVPLEVARRRLPAAPDRLEAEDDGFHRRVAEGYRELARADPDRWVVVDADAAVDTVAARVLAAVSARMSIE